MTDKKQVIVADDDLSILEVIKIVLEDRGFLVTTVSEGKKVMETIKASMPDIILLDIWMSGYDGRDFTRKLKADPNLKSIPLIILSAHTDAREIAEEAGADDFLAKPFDINILGEMVERWVNK